MSSQTVKQGHYFICRDCFHVVLARSFAYFASCPVCNGLLLHDCSKFVKLLFEYQKGGEKDAGKSGSLDEG